MLRPPSLLTTPLILFLTLFLLLPPPAASQDQTMIYIDTVPGYSSLVSCAETRLSQIVRAMSSGCGDGGALTSYTCFCNASSSTMRQIINTAVTSQCWHSSPAEQASSAIDVFEQYCAIGVEKGLEATARPSDSLVTKTATATATPAASAAVATQTGGADGSSGSDRGRTTAIAAGMAVPVGVLVLALGAFFWYRARRRAASGENVEGGGKREAYEAGDTAVVELAAGNRVTASVPPWEIDSRLKEKPVETDGVAVVSELDGDVRR